MVEIDPLWYDQGPRIFVILVIDRRIFLRLFVMDALNHFSIDV